MRLRNCSIQAVGSERNDDSSNDVEAGIFKIDDESMMSVMNKRNKGQQERSFEHFSSSNFTEITASSRHDARPPTLLLLRGMLKLIDNSIGKYHCVVYDFDAIRFQETQRNMKSRKRRRTFPKRMTSKKTNTCHFPYRKEEEAESDAALSLLSSSPPRHSNSSTSDSQKRTALSELMRQRKTQNHHASGRFIGFLFVQGKSMFYSPHTLQLRQLLALYYQEYLTIIVIMVGDSNGAGGRTDTDQNTTMEDVNNSSMFCQGTGFVQLVNSNSNGLDGEATTTLLALLNVTQLPTLIVLDTQTGRPLPIDPTLLLLAMEQYKEDVPNYILQFWNQGQSGLSTCQTITAILTCQASYFACVIQ